MREKGNFVELGDDLFGGGVFVKVFLHRLAVDQMLVDDFGNIFQFDFLIENIPWLYHHDGTHGTETVAAGFHDLHFFAQPLGIQFALQRFDHLDAAGGVAACTAAGQQIGLVPESHALGLLFLDSFEVIH